MRIIHFLTGLFIFGFAGAQDWQQGKAIAFRAHQLSYPNQTVLVFIQTPDTSFFIKFGPKAEAYNNQTYFRAGGLLQLRQGYFMASKELEQAGFMDALVRKDISAQQLLTHRSGYPRFPWNTDSCHFTAFSAFLDQYKPTPKSAFQTSFVGTTLLEQWLRFRSPDYPQAVLQEWNIKWQTEQPQGSVANVAVIKQALPINCWPYCITCADQAAYVQAEDIRSLISQMISKDNLIWMKMMEVLGKTPVKDLQMGYAFQIATNLKKLPLAMHASSDGGNAMFLAFTPTTQTAIAILGDSDEPVDNLGLTLMSSFHRDILNFKP
jgi:hypothetical protein